MSTQLTYPLSVEPLLTQNKSFFVYIYKDIRSGAQRVYVVKKNLKKTEFLDWFRQEIGSMLEDGERQEIMLRLLEHEGISRLNWAIAQHVELDKKVWASYIQDLKKQKPIQYILGYEYFAGEKFMVDSNVLIPRPETEELVNWIAKDFVDKEPLKILEIGTGSGCIAISLKKKLPHALITATDISEEALKLAKQNAENLKAPIKFVKDNVLASKMVETEFDIIVSNPPYIPIDESDAISERVKDFEPSLALFTQEKKPLQFYEAILELSKKCLKPNGALFFEVHEDYAQDVQQLAEKNNWSVQIQNDLFGKPRMIKIQ